MYHFMEEIEDSLTTIVTKESSICKKIKIFVSSELCIENYRFQRVLVNIACYYHKI